MANVVGVGIATLDIINITESYPREDSETRALSQRVSRGGNTANSLMVLSQLGHSCQLAASLATDQNSNFVTQDLRQHNIDLHRCQTFQDTTTPTSYITLNKKNGSRTIVHYRNLPEYPYQAFCKHPLHEIDWIHFEARNIQQMKPMLDFVISQRPKLRISIEIEKPREHLEEIYAYGDIIFLSHHFATAAGFKSAKSLLTHWRQNNKSALLVCPWGEQGAFAIDQENKHYHNEAVNISNVVDTIGAGDTFIAGFIHASLQYKTPQECLYFANRLAASKCSILGFENLVEKLDFVK